MYLCNRKLIHLLVIAPAVLLLFAILPSRAICQTQVIAPGSSWKYFDQGADLGTAWREPAFDDSNWDIGSGIFGYGNGNETTVIDFGGNLFNKHITTYFRKTFTVGNPLATDTMFLSLLYDDGVVAYLNGTEIARGNMPPNHDYLTFATTSIGGAAETTYDLTAVTNFLAPGENVLAVEVHQVSAASSDMSFDLCAQGLVRTIAVPEPNSAILFTLAVGMLLLAYRQVSLTSSK